MRMPNQLCLSQSSSNLKNIFTLKLLQRFVDEQLERWGVFISVMSESLRQVLVGGYATV